jgi:hypothetical protein
MTTLSEALSTFRKTIIKHRDHVQAVTKRQPNTPEEYAACNEVATAYNACFHIISGGKSRALKSEIDPLNTARTQYLKEARKLNTALNNLLPKEDRPVTGAMKAAVSRRAKVAREQLLAQQVITMGTNLCSQIQKATWISGSDQDYDGFAIFNPCTVTINGVTTDGYRGGREFFVAKDVERDGPVNLHRGYSMRRLREMSADRTPF